MRDDMAQVVTEKPRAGGNMKLKGEKRRFQRLEMDEFPRREKIRQKWQSSDGYKSFTDVLGPLYRYLLKQVGKPWDSVWSEICKHLPANSTNASHVRDHIFDFVEVKTVLLDGKVCYGEGMLYGVEIRGQGGRFQWQMYVHPQTGLLCKARDERPRRRAPKRKRGIDVPGDPLQQYHRISGIWYIVTLASYRIIPSPYPYAKQSVYDVAYRAEFSRYDMLEVYGIPAYAIRKRQINKRQIERAGLKGMAA